MESFHRLSTREYHWQCRRAGYFNMVKALVEIFWREVRYAEPRLEKACWAEALCLAAGANQIEIVQYLVQHSVQLGVGLNTKDYGLATPLSAGASRGYLDMLRYVIAHGGNVNCVSDEHRNYFYRATADCERAAVKLMLERLGASRVRCKGGKRKDRHSTPE